MHFSLSQKAFFSPALRSTYEATKSWPNDAVNVSADDEARLRDALGRSDTVSRDASGNWVISPCEPEPLSSIQAALTKAIDQCADAARLAVAGDPLRAAEYQVAEAEAKAYRAAGYAGDVPPSIKSWAEAKQWPAKQAADNILAEAAAWNSALYAIRDARLKAKESVRNAPNAEGATSIANAAIESINALVKNLGNAAS